MPNRWRGFLTLILFLLITTISASAQTTGQATLSRPQVEQFPIVQAYLDVRDASGNFVHGLQASSVTILENDVTLPVSSLVETRTGAQLVIALNLGQPLAVQNSQAVSRLDQLLAEIGAWADSRQGSSIDDLSLILSNGSEATHTTRSGELLAITRQEVDARNAAPNLDVLSRAIGLAADPTPRAGMGRAVLFVTPPLDPQLGLSLDSLALQATQQGVALNVWMVSSAGGYAPQSVTQLSGLAEQTGGQFFNFTGQEQLPDLESYLEPLRSIYALAYDSLARTSGTYQVSAKVSTPEGELQSAVQSFEIDVRPPEPAFVSPPMEIRRTPPETSSAQLAQSIQPPLDSYEPKQQFLEIVVSFPDERLRPLTRTAMFVDGLQVAENTQPPFETFRWDISTIITDGSHTLRAEAQDDLGLVGSSIDMVVQVDVAQPTQPPLAWLTKNLPAIAGLMVVLAGAVLVMVLVLGGKIRPHIPGRGKAANRKNDPVTQPVPVKTEPALRARAGWANRLHWPKAHVAPQAYAFLGRVTETDELAANTPIPVTADEITLGSDPLQAMLVINDPSVEALHARLTRQEDGSFILADQGSVAGSWVNYTPITQEGILLQHGDLLHVGRVGFRFTLRQPGQTPKPVITRLELQSQRVAALEDEPIHDPN